MQAILALEDGRIFRGKGFGAGARVCGRGGVQHVAVGLSGDFHGSLVCRADRGVDESAYRQLRDDAGGCGVARPMIEGLVTREFSAMSSNWRSNEVADEYLERSGFR